MAEELRVVVKGAGEVASGVAHYLFSKGMQVIMTEVPEPTTQRRTVAFAEAVFSEEVEVEGVKARRAEDVEDVSEILERGMIPVIVDPQGKIVEELKPEVLVDGIMAKRNTGTEKDEAELVIGLGPGFAAGRDADVVVETAEGPAAGKVIYEGSARPDTGVPCEIEGYTTGRVLRAPTGGIFRARKEIADLVEKDEVVGQAGDEEVKAEISGTVRGLIRNGLEVSEGQKLGDIDPRGLKEFGISDRSLEIGKGVWKAIDDLA